MRHRIAASKLGTDSTHRKAILRNLLRALFEQGSIVTTKPKAKASQRLADKLLTRAKTDSLHNRRVLHQFFGKRDVVNALVEKIAPAAAKRQSGFTRVEMLSKRRGDNTAMVRLSLVDMPVKMGTLQSGKDHSKRPKAKESKIISKKKPSSAKASKGDTRDSKQVRKSVSQVSKVKAAVKKSKTKKTK